jgi:hypothetical protein
MALNSIPDPAERLIVTTLLSRTLRNLSLSFFYHKIGHHENPTVEVLLVLEATEEPASLPYFELRLLKASLS